MSKATERNPKGAGRPLGAVQTPHTLLKAELRATAQTLAKVRQFIEKQITILEKQLDVATMEQRLAAIDTITSVTEKLTKAMEAAAKQLAPKGAGHESEQPTSNKSPEELLADLLKS